MSGPTPALVAVDVDGTLYDDRRRISAANREAIRACAEAGVTVVIATGRMYRSAARIAEELSLDGPIIAYNGAMVRSASETFSHRPLGRDAALDMIGRSRRLGAFCLAFVDDRVYSERNGHPRNEEYRSHSGVEVEVVADLTAVFGGEGPTKLLFIAGGAEIDGLDAELRRSPFADRAKIARSMADMIEATDAAADKGAALSALARRLGIGADRVAAIGDAENDLGMLASVPVSIAMGNASREVKAICAHETLGNNEDGVAVALRRYVLQREA